MTACQQEKVINVSMHLYKVSQGDRYCYIFGTNHVGKDYDCLDEVTEKAFSESDQLILEVDMDISQAQKYVDK